MVIFPPASCMYEEAPYQKKTTLAGGSSSLYSPDEANHCPGPRKLGLLFPHICPRPHLPVAWVERSKLELRLLRALVLLAACLPVVDFASRPSVVKLQSPCLRGASLLQPISYHYLIASLHSHGSRESSRSLSPARTNRQSLRSCPSKRPRPQLGHCHVQALPIADISPRAS